MNPHELKRLFPNASRSLVAANSELPHTKPQQHKAEPLPKASPRKEQSTQIPHVCFILRRCSLLDVDAKWASVKDLLDGLQRAGLISGDKEGEITLEVRQEKVSHRPQERTEIEITY
jgi:hypothetical protein